MRRLPMVLASSVLCALLSIGCKQSDGERCERHSDCSSGFCSTGNNPDFTSPTGMGKCQSGPMGTVTDGSTFDVPAAVDTASDRGDVAADTADGAPDVGADVAADGAPASSDAADAQAD